MSPPVLTSGARYRLGVLSRVVAACVGGYAVTALVASALALLLPRMSSASRADAVLIAGLLSFAIYTVVALWVFRARSAWHAWRGLGWLAVLAGLLIVALWAAA
jgi:hypothetical protein